MQEETKEVHLFQGIGKKNRPVFVLRLLVEAGKLDGAIKSLFENTTTIGVGYWPVSKATMKHSIVRQKKGSKFVRVKISRINNVEKRKDRV